MDRNHYVDELGYAHGIGSADPHISGVDYKADRFGLPHDSRAALTAAIDEEDASSLELDQRRYAMEQAIIAAEKNRMVAELAKLAGDLYWFAVGIVQKYPKENVAFNRCCINQVRAIDFANTMRGHAGGHDLDRVLFRHARSYDADTISITEDEARHWKP